MSTQSKACCTVPPVVSEGYKEKGEWITINGMKTYATGPKDAKSALLVVYDIFGFFPQTLQGADILAHSDKDHQYQVFMPGKYLSGVLHRQSRSPRALVVSFYQAWYFGSYTLKRMSYGWISIYSESSR